MAQFLQQDDDDDLEDILSSQNRDTSQIHLRNQLSTIMDRLCATEQLAVIEMVSLDLGLGLPKIIIHENIIMTVLLDVVQPR